MLIRIKFAKYGAVKFIGHLDTMRYFQKVLFRSALPVRYSEGFNPHPILEFANPLGVGISSSGEYLDFELTSDLAPAEIEERIRAALTDGFELIRLTVLEDRVQGVKKASAMSLVDRADYLIYDETCGLELSKTLKDAFEKYISQESIMINAPTKKTDRTFDLKEYLFGYGFEYNGFLKTTGANAEDEKCVVNEKEGGFYLYLRLSSGSAMNIRPEIVLSDFLKAAGLEETKGFALHRLEMFHITEAGAVPLWAVR